MDKIRNILKRIKVVQTVSNEERQEQGLNKLGRGFSEAHRLNPYNPLSYIVLIIVLIVGTIMFGIVGFWKETANYNPFNWD